MPNRLFQSIINQMRDATDRIIGVVDDTGTVISCSELGLIGESRKGVVAAGVFSGAQVCVDTYLFDKCNIGFADADNEILCFVREEVLHNIKNGNIGVFRNTDDENNPCGIIVEAKFTGFDVDITRKNIVEYYIFNKV